MTAASTYSADVHRAAQAVPRRKFVPHASTLFADLDEALPIACGQTISQTSLVEWMTELLSLRPGDKVLEIGTGSGYQAAVLAELGYVEVYSVEVIPELAAQAAERLRALGYGGIHLRCGDGYAGWPAAAPFDGIVLTAAIDHVPPPLAEQLAEGGRLVIPLGRPRGPQVLWQYLKRRGQLVGREIAPVAFVPFTRAQAAGGKDRPR